MFAGHCQGIFLYTKGPLNSKNRQERHYTKLLEFAKKQGIKTNITHIKSVVENMKKDTRKKIRILGQSGTGGPLLDKNRLTPSQIIIKELMNERGNYSYSVIR